MVRAIIFDCFGVLTTEGWLAFKSKYFGSNPGKMQTASDLSHQLDRGLISYQEMLEQIAKLAGVTKDELDVVLRDNVVDDVLLAYIRDQLKPKYKIGMLSNVRKNWVEEVFDKKDLELFDCLCLSNETGVVKPDPRAYMAAAEGLGINPEEAVFVDDLISNVDSAEVVGMQGIHYVDFAQFKSDLEKLLAADSKS